MLPHSSQLARPEEFAPLNGTMVMVEKSTYVFLFPFVAHDNPISW